MRLRTSLAFILVGILMIGVAACSSQKAPAEAAIKAAQDAYGPVSAEAQKYVPDQASAIQASIAAAQDAFNKGDFPTAQSKAQAASAQISGLGPAIAAKKTELTTQWTTLATGVPKLIEALRSRVEILAKSKSLPSGITKETVESAQSGLASATRTWSDAAAAAAAGDVATAASSANSVKTQIVSLMRSLNMTVPAGAGGE